MIGMLSTYRPQIYSYIITVVKDDSLADDLCQEVITKVHLAIEAGKYKDDGKPLNWLIRVCKNHLIDYYRLQNKKSQPKKMPILDIENDSCCQQSCIEDDIISTEVEDLVVKLIKHLPEEQQDVVVLRLYEGLDFKTIAKLTGASVNTCLGRFRYAKMNIKKLIEKHNITF